jgi:hypothetical protein
MVYGATGSGKSTMARRLSFLADENIDTDLVLGLRRRVDDIDIVRV